MKKILHLTIGHSPFDDRIFYKECSLLKRKYAVLILAFTSDGSIKDMSGKKKNPGIYDDIFIDGFQLQSRNRYIRYLERKLYGYTNELIKKLDKHNFKPDLIHCHEPNSLIQARKLKRYYNCKLIFDTHEFFLGYSFDRYKNPLRSYLHFAEELWQMKHLFKYVDATISVNDNIRSYNVILNPYVKHIVVSNGYMFEASDQAAAKVNDKIVLVHEGTLRHNRGLKFMINCFDDDWFKKNVILKIVGELKGQEKLYFDDQVRRKPWLLSSIVQTGWIDYLDVSKYLSGSIGLILLEPEVNNLFATPNKLFNYISASLPIISYDIPPSTRMIEMYDVGLVVDRNHESFKQGVRKIVVDYQLYKNNIDKAKKYFAFSSETDKLYGLYDQLLQ